MSIQTLLFHNFGYYFLHVSFDRLTSQGQLMILSNLKAMKINWRMLTEQRISSWWPNKENKWVSQYRHNTLQGSHTKPVTHLTNKPPGTGTIKGNSILTSRERSCLKPHTHAATDTGETKKSGMKTKSQKWVPLSTRAHTSTSKVRRSKWIPTAMSMALNSTQVSPSALKQCGMNHFNLQCESIP